MLKAGYRNRALELFKEDQEKQKGLNLQFFEAHTNLSLGQLEIKNKNFSEAIKLLKRSVSTFGSLGMNYYCANAQARLGVALEGDGEIDKAKSRFAAANRLFEDLGIRNEVERIRGD